MARRHRWKDPESLKPFHGALQKVDEWERRVCYSTVTVPFTIHDVIEWLYPSDVLRTLREAFKLTDESHPDRREVIKVVYGVNNMHILVEIQLDCDVARICTPKAGLADAPMDPKFIDVFYQINNVVQEWNVVRDVVQWFNDNATPSAARYYFPAMGNFLPADHDFHQASGVRFVEPKRSIGEIAPKVRQAAETVTTALFCPDTERDNTTGLFLTILGDASINMKSKSQAFRL